MFVKFLVFHFSPYIFTGASYVSFRPDPLEGLKAGPRELGLKSRKPNPVMYRSPSQDGFSNQAISQGSSSNWATDYDTSSWDISPNPSPNGLLIPISVRDDFRDS